jgi:hypothetical protein
MVTGNFHQKCLRVAAAGQLIICPEASIPSGLYNEQATTKPVAVLAFSRMQRLLLAKMDNTMRRLRVCKLIP